MLGKIDCKKIAADLAADIAGSIFYAVGIYVFAENNDFAVGGVSGISLLLNHLYGLPVGTAIFIFNIPLMIISYKYIGKQFLLKTIRSMALCTLFLDVVFPNFPVYSGSRLLAALYSGVFVGMGLAVFYMRGTSSGGTDFLIMTIKHFKPYLSIGSVTVCIDFIIIILGWRVFGNIDSALYGLISIFITSIVVDKIMYRIGAAKMLIIITGSARQTAERISDICKRGSTIISAAGAYTGNNKQMLVCACSNSQVYTIKRAAMECDGSAFIILTDASKIYGEGFLRD